MEEEELAVGTPSLRVFSPTSSASMTTRTPIRCNSSISSMSNLLRKRKTTVGGRNM
uniref:Uncharacterized protein n=1 Tax=Anopheles christyi TaxID=43041 RepID=A0A182KHU2_9DIPT